MSMSTNQVRNLAVYATRDEFGFTKEDGAHLASEFVTMLGFQARLAWYNLFLTEVGDYFVSDDSLHLPLMDNHNLVYMSELKSWALSDSDYRNPVAISDKEAAEKLATFLTDTFQPPKHICEEFARGLIASKNYTQPVPTKQDTKARIKKLICNQAAVENCNIDDRFIDALSGELANVLQFTVGGR